MCANIYMDESGNTGSNLMDFSQPIFSLASCNFSDEDAKRLIGLLGSDFTKEAHFKNLRRRKIGQDGIIRLMSDPLINTDNIYINIVHKEFMIITKIVDILVEQMMYFRGIDFYRDGRNIAFSNLLFYCFNSFCDKALVFEMYESFLLMIKNGSPENIRGFYEKVKVVMKNSSHEGFKDDVGLILSTGEMIGDILDGVEKDSLDPSIPSLFLHCVRWGKKHPTGFNVFHDNSLALERKRAFLSCFMDWTQDDIVVGYDRRKFGSV